MEMKELIAKIDFFSGLDEKILKKLADVSIMRQYTKNETIVRQGEMGLGLYVIAHGNVKVDRDREQVAELGPEQFFGEMSLLDNKPRSATVTSLGDVECLLLTRDNFVKLMNKFPEIPIRMARVLADRLRQANEKLAERAQRPAEKPAPAAASREAAPQPQTAPPPATTPNGASPAASGDSTKGKIEKTLIDAFQSLYTLKAMTRFTVAVLGCPVEGVADNLVDHFSAGEVKVLIFPAGEPVSMRVVASEPGEFTLHVFTPQAAEPQVLGPAPIRPSDDVLVSLA